MLPNMMGAYGEWAAARQGERPGTHSLRARSHPDLDGWRAAGVAHTLELLSGPAAEARPEVTVEKTWRHEGLVIEDLSWQLAYGPVTRAYFLRPADAERPLPGILALHDHGGKKNWGRGKLVRTPDEPPSAVMDEHRAYYGGRAWANALAQEGFAVLVHDAFAFGSRRVRLDEVPPALAMEQGETALHTRQEIDAYNHWAAQHESTLAKSLFAAGLTWPGVVLHEDRVALDILCARPDVDAARIGCGGLSGGGLRTVYLGGLDERVRAAVCVGMMTTWRDYLLHRSMDHTWMVYAPRLPQALDYPEILGLRAPKPTMVLNNLADPLFTLPEMRRADTMLQEVFQKAGRPDRYDGRFYPGLHKFDLAMQEDAHAFWARHLQ